MKIGLIAVASLVLGATSIGCGPGLSHHGKWAKAPDAVSTTTVTSAPVAKEIPAWVPTSRLPAAEWEEASAPVRQTWGVEPEIDPEYGF